jgi:hypothetical protein
MKKTNNNYSKSLTARLDCHGGGGDRGGDDDLYKTGEIVTYD